MTKVETKILMLEVIADVLFALGDVGSENLDEYELNKIIDRLKSDYQFQGE
jgi:hypothetical protein